MTIPVPDALDPASALRAGGIVASLQKASSVIGLANCPAVGLDGMSEIVREALRLVALAQSRDVGATAAGARHSRPDVISAGRRPHGAAQR